MSVPEITGEEAMAIRAELVAIQAIVISVFRRFVQDRPDVASSFCLAFDEAETILAGVAVKMGVEAPTACAIEALQVLEQIRAGVIRDGKQCADPPERQPGRPTA